MATGFFSRISALDNTPPEQPHALNVDQKVIQPWQALEMVKASEYGPRIAIYRAMAGNEGYYISLKNDACLIVTYDGDFLYQPAQ